MTIWQPGMRCVCINRGVFLDGFNLHPLVKGRVYTVRQVDACVLTGVAALLLVEIDNRHSIGSVVTICGQVWRIGAEPAYAASLFRPLSETRLDVFRALLNPASRKVAEQSL